MRVTRLFFLFLLLGHDGPHHIARFGDVREVDLGCYLLRPRRRGARVGGWPLDVSQMGAHLFRFIGLQRTGVRFAGAETELSQYVKNLPALDFHLAREIVDSNLTHPPLFKTCCQNAP
jgi:hypothetical protein